MTPQPRRTPREVRAPLQQAALAADKTVSLLIEAMEVCPDPLGVAHLARLIKDAAASRDEIQHAARLRD